MKSFCSVSGHSGAFGRVLQQCCQSIRAEYPSRLCASCPPGQQQNRAPRLVRPAQVPPQPLAAVSPSHANLSGSAPAPAPLALSLPRFLSTQLQPHRQKAAFGWRPSRSPQRGGGLSGPFWSGAESTTAVTPAHMYVIILWYVKYMYSLCCTMRVFVFDALSWVHF